MHNTGVYSVSSGGSFVPYVNAHMNKLRPGETDSLDDAPFEHQIYVRRVYSDRMSRIADATFAVFIVVIVINGNNPTMVSTVRRRCDANASMRRF